MRKVSLGEAEVAAEAKTDSKQEEEPRDKFGTTKALRDAIELKYEMVEVIGKGSYGCVSIGKCKVTGQIVALKVMVDQTSTEYEITKVLREIKLNRLLM